MAFVSLEKTLLDFPPPKFGRDCRKLFYIDEEYANLNHGSFGAIPSHVQDACVELLKHIESNPDRFMRNNLYAHVNKARETAAKLIGAETDTCVFVTNIATALNTVLRNFDWTSEDTIILTDAVFDSVSLAVKDIPQRPRTSRFSLGKSLSHKSILIRFKEHLQTVKEEALQNSRRDSDSEDATQPKLVVIMESICASPGLLLPWKDMVRICREENAWSIVDAAHSLGQEGNLNVGDVDPDFWMTNCSKWFYTKRGCAVLYVPFRNQKMISRPVLPSVIYPCPGIDSSEFVSKFYWNGMVDPVPPLSIDFALEFRNHVGGEKAINDYCHSLAVSGARQVSDILGTSYLDSTEVEGEMIANMVNIELPIPPTLKPSKEIFFKFHEDMLEVHKVFAPIFYYNDQWWVRASAQIYNDMSDFKRLGSALKVFCQQLRDIYIGSDHVTYHPST